MTIATTPATSRPRSRSFHRPLAASLLLVATAASPLARAGDLEDLEKEATTEESDSRDKTRSVPNSASRVDDTLASVATRIAAPVVGGIAAAIMGGVFLAAAEGCAASSIRTGLIPARTPSDTIYAARPLGAPDIPFLRGDLNLTSPSPRVEAVHVRVQAGLGPMGVQGQSWRLVEPSAATPTLWINSYHVLMRLSPARSFEFDLGLGFTRMDGLELNNGLSLTMPVTVSPTRRLSLRWIPCWSWLGGDALSDHELSAALTVPFASVHAGWRWLSAGDKRLSGFQAGTSLSI